MNLSREVIKEKSINIAWCIVGNILIGLGVAFAKIACFGNDPFNGSCMAVSEFFSFPYTVYTLCYNCFLFIFEIIFGRKYIGIGTFINWFLLCFAADFFIKLFNTVLVDFNSLPFRLIYLILGLLICGLGVAIYQECRAGVAPYDAVALMICDRHPRFKYFWVRIALDSFSVIVMLVFGGLVSVGTLVSALGLGPVIDFFQRTIVRLRKKKA